jgi:hypothetical protein
MMAAPSSVVSCVGSFFTCVGSFFTCVGSFFKYLFMDLACLIGGSSTLVLFVIYSTSSSLPLNLSYIGSVCGIIIIYPDYIISLILN